MSLDKSNCFFKKEFTPKKIESDVSNFIVYALESFFIVRNFPYCVSLYRLGN